MPLRALIVDDEELGRVNLRCLLGAHGAWRIAGECASAQEARALLAAVPVDLVLLDIHMPKESGLALARSLCAEAEPPLVVFITAYDDHAVEAFELHALDYLLKPLNTQRFGQALERAARMLALRQRGPYSQAVRAYLAAQDQAQAGQPSAYLEQVTVRSVGKIEWVRLADVFWIGAANNYVELHTTGRTILHRASLNALEAKLDPRLFVRTHRGAIVRADQMTTLATAGDGSYLLSLRCGDQVGVSERYIDQVRARGL